MYTRIETLMQTASPILQAALNTPISGKSVCQEAPPLAFISNRPTPTYLRGLKSTR